MDLDTGGPAPIPTGLSRSALEQPEAIARALGSGRRLKEEYLMFVARTNIIATAEDGDEDD